MSLKKLFPGVDTDVPEIVVTIPFIDVPPGTPVPTDEIQFPPYAQHFNMDSAIKAHTGGAFGASDVSSVKIKQIIFTIINPDSLNNLSNFESARFTFKSNSNSVPLSIASFNFSDTYAATTTYIAPANTPELRSYLDGTELTYTVYGKLRRYTTKSIKFSVNITLRVK